MKKVIFGIVIVAIASITNVSILTESRTNTTIIDLELAATAHAQESDPGAPCYAPAGYCADWYTWAHN